jgi:trehalose 6-phosphate phosphatase
MNLTKENLHKLKQAKRIWLLLDYDGTLADFAPTPDDVFPDADLIALLQELANQPKIRLAIISGRRLAHIQKLVPLSGIWLAGSYGVEMRTPSGEHLQRADYKYLRPQLDKLKPGWEKLIKGQSGFYLEDKGWSLALHARYAKDSQATQTLSQARLLAEQACSDERFQILGGHKFLEIAPKEADKGNTVDYLLQEVAQNHIFPIFIGDDDKDERAFPVVQAYGGLAGCVCGSMRSTQANFILTSPQDTRAWLVDLLTVLVQLDRNQ